MGSGCGWDIWNCGLFWGSWTVAYQVPLSMGFSGEEYWSGYSRALLHGSSRPRVEPASLSSPALASEFFTTSATREAPESNNRGPERESRSSCIAFSDLALKPHTILPATEASPHSVEGAGITSAWQVCPRICHCSLENYSLLTAV